MSRSTVRRLAVTVLSAAPLSAFADDFLDTAALHEAGLRTYWQLPLTLENDQSLTGAYLVDDQVYAVTNDGFAYAIHAHTGALRWMQQVTRGGYSLKAPCHADDRTIFVTPAAVTQYHRVYGDPILQFKLRWPAGTTAVSDGEHFYFGSLNGRFYAFQLNLDFDIWRAGTGARITSTPALFGGDLYVASEDKTVYACLASNKRFRWTAHTAGAITADLVATEEGVFVASTDHRLYLFDRAYGGTRWRVQLSGPLSEAPVVTSNLAFQYSPKDGLVAVETGVMGVENRVRWIVPNGRKLLTVNKDRAYLLTIDQSILAVSLKDGSVAADVPAAGFTLPMPSQHNASLLVASPDGRVVCLRPIDAPPLDAKTVREALSARSKAAMPEGASKPAEAEPAPKQPEPDVLSAHSNAPLGGKSRVSRNFGRGGAGAASPSAAPPAPATDAKDEKKDEPAPDNP